MTDLATRAERSRRQSPLPAAILIFVVMALATAAAWSWFSLPVAVSLGVGFIEVAPIRRQRGPRVALAATLTAAVVLTIVGSMSESNLVFALLVGLAAFGAGYASRWGLYSAAVLVPLTLVILSSPTTASEVIPRAGALIIGALLGTFLLGILRLDPPTADVVLPNRSAILVGLALALMVGGAVFVTTTYNLYQGHWVPVSVLAIAVPSLAATQDRSWLRTWATVGGAVLASVLAFAITSDIVIVTVALLAGVASATLTKDYSWRIALLTVAVVLYSGGIEDSESAAVARIVATVVGATLVLTVAYVAAFIDDRLGDSGGNSATSA